MQRHQPGAAQKRVAHVSGRYAVRPGTNRGPWRLTVVRRIQVSMRAQDRHRDCSLDLFNVE
jgi:hypothetical protein